MKIPHTFTIVFSIIVLCAVMTWIIPGGEFDRQTVTVDGSERNVVVADSFHNVDNQPQTWQIFTSFFKGFERTANIIVFILMIGGGFWIMNETNAINVGIFSFLKKTQRLQQNKILGKLGVNNLIMILIILMFSLFGSVFGMSEETIAFIVIFVPLAISMGYDSITGVLMCYVAAHVGFAGAMLNPFTIGIAQGLSGLAPFSGIEYRFICWCVFTLVAIIFTLIYAAYIKKNPTKSVTYEIDAFWRDKQTEVTSIESRPSTLATWVVYILVGAVMIYCAIQFPRTDISIGNGQYNIVLWPIIAGLYLLIGFFGAKTSVHHFILTILLFTIITLVTGVLGYGWDRCRL